MSDGARGHGQLMRFKVTRIIERHIIVEASSWQDACNREEQIRTAIEELGDQYTGPRHTEPDENVVVVREDSPMYPMPYTKRRNEAEGWGSE